MSDYKEYNLVIVGGGIAGYSAALKACDYLSVAIIEEKQMGGTCLNKGCIPTKVYRQISDDVRKNSRINDKVRTEIFDKINTVVNTLKSGLTYTLSEKKIEILKGKVVSTRNNTVIFEDDSLQQIRIKYDYLLLATGSKPIIPQTCKESFNNVFTTEKAFEYENILPETMVIIGGGVIGVEFASFLADCGTRVYLVEKKNRILSDFSEDVSSVASKLLMKKGVKICTSKEVLALEEEDEEVIVKLSDCTQKEHSSVEEMLTDKVLLAIGRIPNINPDFINELSLELDDGRIKTDKHMRTSNPKVYAAGDVSCKDQLAYTASEQGRMAGQNIVYAFSNKEMQEDFSTENIPFCVFMQPEIGCVGMTRNISERTHLISKISLKGNGMAVIEGSDDGYIKLVADKETKVLVGAELICKNAVEMISLCREWIQGKKTLSDISGFVFPHPSVSEALRDAAKLIQ